MQQLDMGRASENWDIPIYHKGSEQAISGSDDKFYVDSDVPRKSTVHRVLEAVKEELGQAAPALPPITDPNVALIQQRQIQNQTLIAAIMAQPSVSPVIHKPALPPIRTGPAGEVDLQRFETHMATYEVPRKMASRTPYSPTR